jgi:hypothetical protein
MTSEVTITKTKVENRPDFIFRYQLKVGEENYYAEV